ncbi:MAG: SET domain-containing protein-lysine N-methyltransferase [Arcobacteraceae bacterium]
MEFINDKLYELNHENSNLIDLTKFHNIDNEVQKKQFVFNDVTENLSFVKRATVCNITKGEIAPSNIHGFGLFANDNISQGEILCTLDGQRMSYDEYTKLHNLFRQNGLVPYTEKFFFMEWNMIEKEAVLTRPYRTMYSYINHSKNANCLVMPHDDNQAVDLISTRKITKGEEILLDYTLEPLPNSYLLNSEKSFLF